MSSAAPGHGSGGGLRSSPAGWAVSVDGVVRRRHHGRLDLSGRRVGALTEVERRESRDEQDDENEQNGWPRQIEYRGEMHDYILISVENPNPEDIRRADAIGEARARKRLGLGPEDRLPTPSTTSPDPSEIKFHY